MDEFLSLLENGGSESLPCDTSEEEDINNNRRRASNVERGTSRTRSAPNVSSRQSMAGSTRAGESVSRVIQQQKQQKPPPPPTAVATVGVDEKLGIRMINRLVSSLDLMDLITASTTTSPYYSPARLSAMSLQGLCGILADPPSIIDKATVQGRTQLLTVGIVFHNSGTKTSSKGGAFCILTLGSNLQTGPSLSVFLFGSAYSKFSRTCRAGHVVAVTNPKLLPARDDRGGGGGGGGGKGDNTSVSLSVHDPSQLLLVAHARDYGVCQAAILGKQPDGTWKEQGATCKTFVDTRQSEYCAFHRNQQALKTQNHLATCSAMRGAGGSVTTKQQQGAGGTLVQRLRMERTQTPLGGNRFLNGSKVGIPQPNTVAASYHQPRENRLPSGTTKPLRATTTAATAAKTSSNPFRSEKPKHLLVSATAHSFSNTTGVGSNPLRSTKKESQSQNPYLSRPGSTTAGSNRMIGKPVVSKNQLEEQAVQPAGDWLHEAVTRKTPTQSISRSTSSLARLKVRKVNTVGCGLDGAVVVPKPSHLFNKPPTMMSRERCCSTASPSDPVLLEEHETAIKERQSLMAQTIRVGQSSRTSSSNKFTSKDKSAVSGNAFLDSIQVDNVEDVLNAKSRFAMEADAEEYVKNRRRVVELESMESKQQATRKRLAPEKENQKIQREWVCFSCPNRPRFPCPPKPCINSGHRVLIKRVIKETMTKEDERSKLNEMAAKEGGLMLGQGLEWSRNRFSSD